MNTRKCLLNRYTYCLIFCLDIRIYQLIINLINQSIDKHKLSSFSQCEIKKKGIRFRIPFKWVFK
jgi:hypothetical protein